MRYGLLLPDEARGQLRRFPEEIRRNIGYRLELLQDDLAGDVKKLEAYPGLFCPDGAKIEVKQRKDAYE